jgi:hypothetical protein
VIGLLLLQKVGCRQLPLAVLQVGRCTLVGCSWQHDTLLLGVACVEPCQQFMIVFCHEAQPHLPLKVAVRWMELSVQLRFKTAILKMVVCSMVYYGKHFASRCMIMLAFCVHIVGSQIMLIAAALLEPVSIWQRLGQL